MPPIVRYTGVYRVRFDVNVEFPAEAYPHISDRVSAHSEVVISVDADSHDEAARKVSQAISRLILTGVGTPP